MQEIMEFINLCLKRWKLIAATTILVVMVTALSTLIFVHKIYSTSAMLVVMGKFQQTANGSQYDQVLANQYLSRAYIEIGKSDRVLIRAADKLKIEKSIEVLRKQVSVIPVGDAGIIKITAINSDALMAAKLANSVSETLIEEVKNTMNLENLQLFSPANIPVKPASPNMFYNVMAALFAGIVLSIGVAVFKEYKS